MQKDEEECTFQPRLSTISQSGCNKMERDRSVEIFQKKEEHFFWSKKCRFEESQKEMVKKSRELSN